MNVIEFIRRQPTRSFRLLIGVALMIWGGVHADYLLLLLGSFALFQGITNSCGGGQCGV